MNPNRDHPKSTDHAMPISAKAFGGFYAANFLPLKAFLARTGCDRSSLDDLAQEAFLHAWRGQANFSGKSSFRTWLFAIARNILRQHQIQVLVAAPLDEDLPKEQSDRDSVDADEIEAIRDAIDRLPCKQREATTMVYLEGMTATDAAARTNCDPAVLYSRLFHGRRRLRRLLEAERMDAIVGPRSTPPPI